MEIQNHAGAFEVQLRSTGIARWILAAFLAFWLVFWGFGEAVALRMLVSGWRTSPVPGSDEVPPSVLTLFFLLWGGFWTLGGIGAFYGLMRALWGRDVLRVERDTLFLESHAWPFRGKKQVPLREIVRFDIQNRAARLVAQTTRANIRLTDLGSMRERRELQHLLETRVGRRAEPSQADLPPSWEFQPLGNGQTRLRRVQGSGWGRIVGGLFIAVLACLGLVAALEAPNLRLPHLIGAAVSGLFLIGAAWVAFAQEHWLLSRQGMRRERQFLLWTFQREFPAPYLQLKHWRDSDGDEHWSLLVQSPRGKTTLESGINESAEVMHLGRWMERHVGIPFRVQT